MRLFGVASRYKMIPNFEGFLRNFTNFELASRPARNYTTHSLSYFVVAVLSFTLPLPI